MRAKARVRKTAARETDSQRVPALAAGVVALAIAAGMSLVLILDHYGAAKAPGCGYAGSPCDQATASVFGKVPLGPITWPTSHVGFAYFVAALAAWVVGRARPSLALTYIVRLGALASLFFCVVIVVKWMPCPYCLAAHAGNFAFWIVVEWRRRRGAARSQALAALVATFVLVTGVLAAWDARFHAVMAARGERERRQSVEDIVQRTHADPPTHPARPDGNGATALTTAPAESERPRLTGRYRHGPEVAPIRIVMFTSYQCPDCARVEADLQEVMKRDDVSVSIRYFPFNSECNPCVEKPANGREKQPNGCWAARAAEAAGMLYGAEGFWRMHRWLFEQQGSFDNRELSEALRAFGFEPSQFIATMMGEETLQRVRDDCTAARSLGLHFTPMIFVNGVELNGWWRPRALQRTVEAVLATNPPARGPDFDVPPPALEKYIADWRENDAVELPPETNPRSLGPPDAPVQIVMWGDFEEAGSAEADRQIRETVAARGDVRYSFRCYPFNSDCNPSLPDQRHPHACRMAQAAETARRLGGPDAYWRVHAWLMDIGSQYSDEALLVQVALLGLAPDVFLETMDSRAVEDAIRADVTAGKNIPAVLRLGWPRGLQAVPSIFVNGRYLPRWKVGEENVLGPVIEAAARGE